MSHIWTSTDVAEAYARRRPSIPQRLLQTLVDVSAPSLRSNTLAIDLGCGSSSTALLLSSSFDRVCAMDPSKDQLDAAPRNPNNNSSSRLMYVVGSADTFRDVLVPCYCNDGDVDLICVGTALHWFSDPTAFLASCRDLLRPDGCLAIWTYFFVEFDDEPRVTDVVRRFTIQNLDWWPEQVRAAVDGYVSLLPLFDEANFTLLQRGTEATTTNVESVAAFIEFTRTWSGIIRWSREDAKQCDAALADLSVELLGALGGEDRPLTMRTPHTFWIWRPSRG